MIKNSVKKILNSKLAKRTGISLINYDLLKYAKHYLWIFNLNKIPTLKITFKKVKEVTNDDISLCQRLIDSYRKVTSNCQMVEDNTSQIWRQGIKKHCAKLISALESGSANKLAENLSTMFRDDFIYGLASGSLVENAKSRLGAKIWSLKYQDNIVSLAEYLGLARTESSQQGVKCYGLKTGVDTLVHKIEDAIGIPIDFPDIGSPYGVEANNSLITMEETEHIYVVLRLNQATRDYLGARKNHSFNLVEIGAGFGGLAYWIMKLKEFNVARYTIIDLPLINVVQGYFLGKAFGQSSINLFGEISNNAAMISIIPAFAFREEIKDDFDLLINENSMPEMSEEIVENYIRFAKERLKGLFFSYNHEAYSIVYGHPQVFVPEIVSSVGGFKRLSRISSWVRQGYVEEVYCINNKGNV